MAGGCCGNHNHEHNHHHSTPIKFEGPPHAAGEIVDISGDGGIIKEVITQGSGERPPAEHEVEVHYTGTLEDGTKFDSSRDRDTTFRFVLGQGQVIKGWDLGVASMSVGEKSLLKLEPSYGYGEAGAGGTIPPNAKLTFEVELFSFRKRPKNKYSMNVEEKLQAAADCKERGNAAFKQNKLRDAEAEYQQGIDFLDEAEHWTPDQQKMQQSIELPLRLNVANCYIKFEEYAKAIENATKAIAIDKNSSKAWYRRGVAYAGFGQLAEARGDLFQAAKLDTSNAEIRKELQKCTERLEEAKRKEKSAFQNLFKKVDLYDEKKGLRSLQNCVKVFMDICVGDSPAKRLVFALYDDICPKTVQNFKALCTGEVVSDGVPLTFKGSTFHRIISGFMMQGGDFTNGDGTGGKSIYGDKFADECFTEKHTKRGQLSMANCGPNTNGSQFFITFGSASHLDGKHVAFGEVIEGMEALDEFEKLKTNEQDKPLDTVTIKDCGVYA